MEQEHGEQESLAAEVFKGELSAPRQGLNVEWSWAWLDIQRHAEYTAGCF